MDCLLIGKPKVPQQVRVFLWLLWWNRLLKNGVQLQRHITMDNHYSRCNCEVESGIHAVQDCSFLRVVWLALVPTQNKVNFFSLPLEDWLTWNFNNVNFCVNDEINW